ncbi:FGGY family carbohydrate kinase [Gordonia humi]|uniref:FGGY family carbohydrate kinase n=1 Tax=Gordonia humi TaxID=686429 RepID=UPI003608A7BF
MTLRVVIGIDKGTSTLKTAAIDVASGRFVAEAGARTPSSFPHPGFHEEDADGTWSAVASTIRTVVGALPEEAAIVAVGVTGHMGGVWAIDENGEPVRPAICWPDSRAVSILDRVVEADDGRMFAIGGNAIVPGTPYPLLAWIKEHEPENYRRISTFFMAKDYVNYRLTGVIATEESDLSFAPPAISPVGVVPTNCSRCSASTTPSRSCPASDAASISSATSPSPRRPRQVCRPAHPSARAPATRPPTCSVPERPPTDRRSPHSEPV